MRLCGARFLSVEHLHARAFGARTRLLVKSGDSTLVHSGWPMKHSLNLTKHGRGLVHPRPELRAYQIMVTTPVMVMLFAL